MRSKIIIIIIDKINLMYKSGMSGQNTILFLFQNKLKINKTICEKFGHN